MRFIEEKIYRWILNPVINFSNTVGATLSTDTTAFSADDTGHTADNITV